MNDGFGAEFERIGRRGKDFDEHASRADDVVKELRQALESSGTPWGTDAIGEAFGGAHAGAADEAIKLIGELGGSLGGLGGKFTGAAENYRATEDANVADVAEIDRGLQG